MSMFKNENGNRVEYTKLPNIKEVDLHFNNEPSEGSYHENMEAVRLYVLNAIKTAYEDGKTQYVLFTHGWSTSRRGKTTARSQVRKLMRSKDAAPYIDRARCIQHYSTFVAAIKNRD